MFWYRQSPEPMWAEGFRDQTLIPGVLKEDDPQPYTSGMIDVRLDPQGRLTYLEALPPQKTDSPGPAPAPDWNALFAAAGLDFSKFQPAAPLWTSLAASDARQAWTGQWPGYEHRPLRVEAAAWHGRPVFFSLIGPWTPAPRMPAPSLATTQIVVFVLISVMLLVPIFAAVFLARWNFVRGKGDRRGAMRLAVLMFSLHMALWVFKTHISSVGNFILSPVHGNRHSAAMGRRECGCFIWRSNLMSGVIGRKP